MLICGRFEGVDERVIEGRRLEGIHRRLCFIGGEIAAMVVLDACVRLLPGVMGKEASGIDESFEAGLLEYPHFTRPREWEGREIPQILLSGDHAKIKAWREAGGAADYPRNAARICSAEAQQSRAEHDLF